MAPVFENKIGEEVAEVARELNTKIDLGYEGMEIEV